MARAVRLVGLGTMQLISQQGRAILTPEEQWGSIGESTTCQRLVAASLKADQAQNKASAH